MPEVLSLFNEVLFDVFGRSNINVVSFWTKKDASALVYVCEFENETTKAAAWEAFYADSAWIDAWRDRSNPQNPMVTEVSSEILVPAPFPS